MWNALTATAVAALALTGARSTQPPEIARHTCANGLEVLVVERHAVPLVTIELAGRNGSMTETPDYNGLSHLWEHMFFKANAVLPDQEAWLQRARELGLSWNGTTNTERVNYFVSTTKDNFRDAMAFMRDAVTTPLFDEREFERERVVVTGEIDRNEANPYYHFYVEVQKRVFWKYFSRKNPLGSRETVLAATIEQMREMQRRYYIPNNMVLMVTGDVEAEQVFALADELYAGWRRGPDPFVEHPLVEHPPIPKTEVVVVEQPVGIVSGSLVWHGPSTVGPGVELTYAADLLAAAIAEPSSRFQRSLVDSGACVAAGFSWYTQRNTGPVTASFTATPEKVDQCLEALLAELPRMREADYLTDQEMRNAAFAMEVQEVRARESASQLASTLTFWWTSAGLDYYLGYVDRLYAVERAEIAEFMDRYVLGEPFVFGVLVSPEMRAGGLDQAHFDALLAKAPAELGVEVAR
jgi:zinc protease